MDLSVIIPCYNSGAYLPEALESIHQSSNLLKYKIEVIIVDDGSTDQQTCDLLHSLANKYTVIHQQNAGPGAARNTGMEASRGKYILFLDSDNRLLPDFIDLSIKTLITENADMVYGRPLFFGDTSEFRFKTKKFNLREILGYNYIDTCSVVKRRVWTDMGGFDESPVLIGFEDWDLWVRLGAADYKLHFINKPLYEYRISSQSLIANKKSLANVTNVQRYVYSKHINLIMSNYSSLVYENRVFKNDQSRPLRTFIKHLYLKYWKRN